jgi:hypothetical protein
MPIDTTNQINLFVFHLLNYNSQTGKYDDQKRFPEIVPQRP